MTSTPGPGPDGLFSAVQHWQAWAIPVIIIVVALVLIVFVLIPALLKRHLRRLATLTGSELYEQRKALLTFVKEQSPSKGIAVPLGRFWRGKRISAANRFIVLDDLFDKKILQPAYSDDPVSSFFQVLWWGILTRPPVYVKLSDRDWNQLANGQPISIAIETLIGKQFVDKQDNYDVRLGDVTGSAVAIGTRSNARNQVEQNSTLTPEQLTLLITALRTDAESLGSEHDESAEEAESTADALEADLRAGRLTSAAKKANLLLDVITKSAGAWTATTTILRGLGIG